MISYAMVGSKNLKASGEFFDKVLGVIGAIRIIENERMILWGTAKDQPSFAVCLPFDGNEATSGNGTMISFGADSDEQVKAIYNAARDAGGLCEGEPGIRAETFYIGYFRDLDGNKFSAFHAMA